MQTLKRILAFILILCAFIVLGIVINFLWGELDPPAYPYPYSDLVEQYAKEYEIPEEILYAVIKVESDFDPSATSSVGALGLMQMMPKTFEWLTGDEHLGEHLPINSLYQPNVSIRYGAYYLRYLYKKFDRNWNTVLAAYNGGEGNVAKWLKDPAYSDGKGNLIFIPFDETRSYVSKVNEAIEIYQNNYDEQKKGTKS